MMTTQHILENYHYTFACEVINGLNVFHGIPIELPQPSKDYRIFNNDIRWGLVTISYLFRKDYLKIFSILKLGSKSKKQFEKYCMLISVTKNDRYFFNFLRRVSLIYEMAVCCYKSGNDYFTKAGSCIARYQDKLYFNSLGSWPRLNETASFLKELGKPFLTVMLEESAYSRPLSFPATVQKIESRLEKQSNEAILQSEEMIFLIEQKEKFITREKDEKKNADSQTEKERAFSQCLESTSRIPIKGTADEVSIKLERKAIIEYLSSLLFSTGDNELGEKCESSEVSHSLEPFDKQFQSNPSFGDQQKEGEGSLMKDGDCLTSSDSKYSSARERVSDKSKREENKTNKSEIADKDFSSGSLSGDDESLSLISLSPIKKIISSLNESSSPELPKDELSVQGLLEDENDEQCNSGNEYLEHAKYLQVPDESYSHSVSNPPKFMNSSEDENSQQCSSEKECLERIKNLKVHDESYSQSKSNTSELSNSSDSEVDYMKLIQEDLYKEATLFNPHFSVLPDIAIKQFTSNDDKPGNKTVVSKRILPPLFPVSLGESSKEMLQTADESSKEMSLTALNESVKSIDNTEMNVNDKNSEHNPNMNVEKSQSQHRQRKNKRKKGKRN